MSKTLSCSVFQKQNFISIVIFVCLTVVISLVSYQFIEKPLGDLIGSKKQKSILIITGVMASILLCAFSLIIYQHAGIVRNVPELNVYMDSAHRGMHAEYCDRPYQWDKEFEDNDNLHVLVLGDSFGRDWANILYEYDESIDISYKFYSDSIISEIQNRIDDSNLVFYALSGYGGVPEKLKETVPKSKLYIIGHKSFGESNGIIYAKRKSLEYFNQTIEAPVELLQFDNEMAEIYGNHYVSMMKPVTNAGEVKVFTDDNKFISQDCRHLTQMGAQYYARILNIKDMLNMKYIHHLRK